MTGSDSKQITGTVEQQYYTAEQASSVLGYSPLTLRDPRGRARLGLRAYRVGRTRSIRFRRSEILALVRPEAASTSSSGET